MKTVLPTTLFSFIMHFTKPHWGKYCVVISISVLWAIDLSLQPYLIKIIIDRATEAPMNATLWSVLLPPTALYIGLGFFMSLVYRVHDYLFLKLMPPLKGEITLQMLAHVQHHSYHYFQHHFGGAVATKIAEISRSTPKIIEHMIDNFLAYFLGLLIATITLWQVHPMLTGIMLVWSILFLGGSFYFSKKTSTLADQVAEANSTMIGQLVDSLANNLTVRLFTRQKDEQHYLRHYISKNISKDQALRWATLKRRAAMTTASSLLIASLLGFLIYARTQNLVTIGDFALILTLSVSIIDALWNVAKDLLDFSEEVGKSNQSLSLITQPIEILDDKGAVDLKVSEGRIEFQHVNFGHTKSGRLFNDLSIVIPGHQKVGLVGYSGSGKTSFINLILRLFDVNEGSILIDGQNIAQVTQDSLHRAISFISQDPILFNRSLMENIRYGLEEATEAQVIEAAKQAHAHEFIMSLPHQYHTFVGDRGLKLSGGQRQRIVIARAILKDSSILFLDEPTSALDSLTEHFIQESLLQLMYGKTVLVIAHRLSTLLQMDQLLVFKDGRIIEEGTHSQLLAKDGHYKQLWQIQAGGFLPNTDLLKH